MLSRLLPWHGVWVQNGLAWEELTIFDIGFLKMGWGGGGGAHELSHHYVVVIALMIMKFGTGIKHDLFYTMVKKK